MTAISCGLNIKIKTSSKVVSGVITHIHAHTHTSFVKFSNLVVLVKSAGQSGAVGGGAVDRADSQERHGSQSVALQRSSADVGWGERGSGAAHCHSRPGAALSRAGGSL